jgi:hypothetical protein
MLTLQSTLFLIVGSIGGVLFVFWWMFTVSKWFQAWEDESVIRYVIDVPKPAGDGTALEKPSIKVRSHRIETATLLTYGRLLARQLFSATHRRLANSLVL